MIYMYFDYRWSFWKNDNNLTETEPWIDGESMWETSHFQVSDLF